MKKFIVNLALVLVLAACGSNASATTAPAPGSANEAPGGATKTPTATASSANSNSDSNSNSNSDSDSNANANSNANSNGAPPSPGDCTNSAAFVSDVTVHDNQLFEPGEKFEKTWRIKNTGTCPWSADYALTFSKGNRMGAPTTTSLEETQPGDTLDTTVKMTAPADENVTTVRSDFEIHDASGAAIPIDDGTTLWVIIRVSNDVSDVHDTGGGGGGSAGPGFASVSCAYQLNQSKINEVITALNAYRAQNGLAPFTVSAQLNEAAQAHANDMACNQLFYHSGSNGSTPASRVAASGYAAAYVTENVYGSYPPLDGPGVISWWANDTSDPRHNENLLSTKYTEIGIGYSFANNYGYFVIDFAVPA